MRWTKLTKWVFHFLPQEHWIGWHFIWIVISQARICSMSSSENRWISSSESKINHNETKVVSKLLFYWFHKDKKRNLKDRTCFISYLLSVNFTKLAIVKQKFQMRELLLDVPSCLGINKKESKPQIFSFYILWALRHQILT